MDRQIEVNRRAGVELFDFPAATFSREPGML
jgi:hypothetical protein